MRWISAQTVRWYYNEYLENRRKILLTAETEEKLRKTARKLWNIHREMEDHLHARVVGMFNIEEKIYLFEITNT